MTEEEKKLYEEQSEGRDLEMKTFLENYSYKLGFENLNLLTSLRDYKDDKFLDALLYPNSDRSYYEVAHLYSILSEANKEGGGIIVKSKTTNKKIEVLYNENIVFLLEKISQYLIDNRHDDYMEQFGWGWRDNIPPLKILKWKDEVSEEVFNNFLEEVDLIDKPYTDEEIKKILEYEKRQLEIINIVKRERLSFYLNRIVDSFKKEGIFETKPKTISTKDACFLYDYLLKLELKSDNTLSPNEKYQEIKNELNKLKNKKLQDEDTLLIP